METQLQIGDEVEIINHYDCSGNTLLRKVIIEEIINGEIRTNVCSNFHPANFFRKINKTEEITMQIKEIKKENMKEAIKQFSNERKNEEIEYAKKVYGNAIDKINEIDRQIKNLEEQKKPYQETIKMFG